MKASRHWNEDPHPYQHKFACLTLYFANGANISLNRDYIFKTNGPKKSDQKHIDSKIHCPAICIPLHMQLCVQIVCIHVAC